MANDLDGKSVLVCVTGGIAAYKVCDVVSKLAQRGANVTVAMTEAATKFVGSATFQALSANPVYTDLWEHVDTKDPQHIRLAQKVDLILVAPCTGDMVGKMANGLADDLVSTILLAANPKKVVIVPAMNEEMWNHPATQRNIKQVMADGVELIGPGSGWQACRTVGIGRMSESAEIIEMVARRCGKK
jgi:phosphopantothenoylcysteine decarboxylase/phosphopantothenate--cysteine ligase